MESVKVTTFEEYRRAAMRTCTESSRNAQYMILEIQSEVGEVAGKVAKMIRDDNGELTEERREQIIKELGDVMWGIVGLAEIFGVKEYKVDGFVSIDDYCENFEKKVHKLEFVSRQKALWLAANNMMMRAGELARFALTNRADEYLITWLVGDVANMALRVNSNLHEVLQCNIDKLADRYNRNTIHGSGDNR